MCISCELLPSNKRLKQLIKQYGKMWKVLRLDVPVQCFKDCKTGYLIESLDKQHSRWVMKENIKLLEME